MPQIQWTTINEQKQWTNQWQDSMTTIQLEIQWTNPMNTIQWAASNEHKHT